MARIWIQNVAFRPQQMTSEPPVWSVFTNNRPKKRLTRLVKKIMNIRENSFFKIWNSLSNVVRNLLHAIDDKRSHSITTWTRWGGEESKMSFLSTQGGGVKKYPHSGLTNSLIFLILNFHNFFETYFMLWMTKGWPSWTTIAPDPSWWQVYPESQS